MGAEPGIPGRGQAGHGRTVREAELWVGVDVVARYRRVRSVRGELVVVLVIGQLAAVDGPYRTDEAGPLFSAFQRNELRAQHEGSCMACLRRSGVWQQELVVAPEPGGAVQWRDRAAPGLRVPRDQSILVEDGSQSDPDVSLCRHGEEDRDVTGAGGYLRFGIHRV